MNRGFLAENAKNSLILAKIDYFFGICDIFITKLRPKLNNSEIINIFCYL
jgi:hypothetical protein